MKTGLKSYAAMLWAIMGHTGKGYHRPSVKHTGVGDDRRNDKLKAVEATNEKGEPIVVYVERARPETKFQRACRLERVGL